MTYERPANTPYTILRDVVCESVRSQMLRQNNRYLEEINYTADRDSLRQLSTIKVKTGTYRKAYNRGLDGGPLPEGRLVEEAGYIHGLLVRENNGYAISWEECE